MSTSDMSLERAVGPIFQPIQAAIRPLIEYTCLLEKMTSLTKPIGQAELSLIKKCCDRVKALDIDSICRELEAIKVGVFSSGRILSDDESAHYEYLITMLKTNQRVRKSSSYLEVNLTNFKKALDESRSLKGSQVNIRVKRSRECDIPVALVFPKKAATIALSILKGQPSYRLECVMGKGSYGQVSKITIDGSTYALKQCRSISHHSEFMIQGAVKGMIAQSPAFLEIASIDSEKVLFEAGGADLSSAFKSPEAKAEIIKNIPRYTRQLITGLAYLHHQFLVHRDIKLQNILIIRNPLDPTKTDVKLIDYDNIEKEGALLRFFGTLCYLSPEIVKTGFAFAQQSKPFGESYQHSFIVSSKNDMWALGITIYKLLSGKEWIKPIEEGMTDWHFFLMLCKLEQNEVDRAIDSLGNDEIIKCLGISKLDEEMIQEGIPLAQKKLIDEAYLSLGQVANSMTSQQLLFLALKAHRKGVPIDPEKLIDEGRESIGETANSKTHLELISIALDKYTNKPEEEVKLREFIKLIGKESYLQKHGEAIYEKRKRYFGEIELASLKTILQCLLRINPEERFSAEAYLSHYQIHDSSQNKEWAWDFFEIDVLIEHSKSLDREPKSFTVLAHSSIKEILVKSVGVPEGSSSTTSLSKPTLSPQGLLVGDRVLPLHPLEEVPPQAHIVPHSSHPVALLSSQQTPPMVPAAAPGSLPTISRVRGRLRAALESIPEEPSLKGLHSRNPHDHSALSAHSKPPLRPLAPVRVTPPHRNLRTQIQLLVAVLAGPSDVMLPHRTLDLLRVAPPHRNLQRVVEKPVANTEAALGQEKQSIRLSRGARSVTLARKAVE
jgi:serine/threonine protein kinase